MEKVGGSSIEKLQGSSIERVKRSSMQEVRILDGECSRILDATCTTRTINVNLEICSFVDVFKHKTLDNEPP
jgi:hypothetical protein